MKRNFLICIAGLMIIMGILTGCKNRTVVTETVYFPSSASASTAEYTLLIQMYGAPGKAFVDTSKKQVAIYIKQKEDILLEDTHKFEAGEIKPRVVWKEAGELSIDFISPTSKQEDSADSLVHLEYVLDKDKRSFRRM